MFVDELTCLFSYTVKNQGGPITANNPAMHVEVCDINKKCYGIVEFLNDLVNPGSQKTFKWIGGSTNHIYYMGSPITLTISPGFAEDKSNNSLTYQFQCLKAIPDLKVSKVWIAKYTPPETTTQYVPLTGDPVIGEKVYLVCEFSNTGGELKGSWKIGYYVDGKQVYYQNFGDIPAGQSQNPAGWYIPDKVGSHQYECILDDGNAITEKDENNNRMKMQFNVVQNPKSFSIPDNKKTILPQPKLPPVK